MLFDVALARRTECPSRRVGNRRGRDEGSEIRDQGSVGVRTPRLLLAPGAVLRAAAVLSGAVLTHLRTRARTLRAGTGLGLPGPLGQARPLRRPLTAVRLAGPRSVRLSVRVLRALFLVGLLPRPVRVPGPLPVRLPRALRLLGPLPVRLPLPRTLCPPLTLPLTLSRPRTLPLRQPQPLLLPGSALRLARAGLGVARAAGTLLLARAGLRRPGTDGARQRLADLELGPFGHLADLGHDVTALTHESVVDREVVGGGGGGSHGGLSFVGGCRARSRAGVRPQMFSAAGRPPRYTPPCFVQERGSCPERERGRDPSYILASVTP